MSSNKATLYITFGDNSNTWAAAYDFSITKSANDTFVFELSEEQGEENPFDENAYEYAKISWIASDVQPLINYLGNTSFNLDWYTPLKDVTPQEYLKFINFKDSKDSKAIMLGQITPRKY
jgi:hypothetical protein